VFTIGEVLSNDTQYIKPYTEVLDAVLDYSTWTPLVAGFQTPFGNLSALASSVNTLQTSFKNGAKMTGSFLENHDQPRFQSLTNDSMLVRNAVAWPFVYDGIPILYYGQEQGYQGGPDPSNREAYVTDRLRSCRLCAR
jgi:alpha-amylase